MLQILYLKHIKLHKLPWIETHENLIPKKINNDTLQFYCYITIVNKNIPYNWSAGSQQVLSSICVISLEYVTKGYIVMHTILL